MDRREKQILVDFYQIRSDKQKLKEKNEIEDIEQKQHKGYEKRRKRGI